jgi:precorrin-6y C5,15-methyltransferase (decarboxylating) CbiE subunit
VAVKELKITIVGCGPGALDYLTPAAAAVIARAEVLIGTPRLLDLFPDRGAERISMGKDSASILPAIAARQGKSRIVVLVTGDPGLYSLAAVVSKRFGRASCEILPGISALQTAFARLGVSWEDAKIISTHAEKPAFGGAELCQYGKIAILGGDRQIAVHLAPLINFMMARDYRIFVGEDLTLPAERFYEIAGDNCLPDRPLSTRAIILIVRKDIL